MRLGLSLLLAAMLGVASATAAPTASEPSGCEPPLIGVGAVGEGRNNADLMPPTVGRLRILALFVDFPDARGSRDPALQYGDVGLGLADWYDTVSYGRLRIELELVPRWLTMRHPTTYYYGAGRIDETFAEAVTAVDPEVDFSRIDALYLTPAAGPDGGWIVISENGIVADGKTVRATGWNPLGSVIHETGHVLGLPDLYISRVPRSFYRWDVMAGGGRPSGLYAWHRWKLGWLDGTQITCLVGRGRVEATVTPVETAGGVKAVVVRSGRAAYVAEVRQRIGEDSTICKTGVLVYEVDLTGARRPIWLRPARLDGSSETGSCGGLWRAPFDLGRGEIRRVTVGGVRFELLQKLPDGSYRIRATKTR
jgi:M6 family metalloprotease-like protein